MIHGDIHVILFYRLVRLHRGRFSLLARERGRRNGVAIRVFMSELAVRVCAVGEFAKDL